MAFRKDNKIKSNFSKISIGLASPEEILENSSGEVLKPETIKLYVPLNIPPQASFFIQFSHCDRYLTLYHSKKALM